MINTILFDLDGTLLPMDQELFIKLYFNAISSKFQKHIPQKDFMKALLTATDAVFNNDGLVTNEELFWSLFPQYLPEDFHQHFSEFDSFYENEFIVAKDGTSPSPLADKCIKILKEKGYTLVIASNPVFPRIATEQRIKWAGLNPSDFVHITTYENSRFCKPNPKYYREVLQIIDKKPEECIMIGNDYQEDMMVESIGITGFLLDDCLINRDDSDISCTHRGSFEDLLRFVEELPALS